MNIEVLASGSKGNCYLLHSKHNTLLIECGIRFKRIKEALNFNLSNVVGCLVTHVHADHCKSIKDLINAGIDVYTSKGTIEALNIKSHRIKPIRAKEKVIIDNFEILPFDIEHDAPESLGFLIKDMLSNEKLLFITDSYYCKYKFKAINYLMIECNYDADILQKNYEEGFIYAKQYERLLKSHMSFENCKEFLKANDLSKCKEIYLLHTSTRHSDTDRFKREIEELTNIKTIIAGGLMI